MLRDDHSEHTADTDRRVSAVRLQSLSSLPVKYWTTDVACMQSGNTSAVFSIVSAANGKKRGV